MKPAPNSYAALGLSLPQPRNAGNIIRLNPRASGQAPRQTKNQTSSNANYFEALRESQDRTPLPLAALSSTVRRLIRGYDREKLSALGDYLYDNFGRVSYAVDTIA